MQRVMFGVAGFPINFFSSSSGKKRENIFKWLREELDLDLLELQCTYGIKMPKEQAIHYRSLAEKYDITLTMHAPYYISLSSKKADVVVRSKETVLKAFELANTLGVKRIIFHPGGGYENREKGLDQLIDALNDLKKDIKYKDIYLYPEIGGKVNQLGSLDEIIKICKSVDYTRPCIDLAHLHAREIGSLTSKDKILEVMDKIEKELGSDILGETHFHVYPVDYTEKGEKVHKSFADKKEEVSLFEEDNYYYPRAEHYIEALKVKKINAFTICEAHNSQDIGAMLMKKLYEEK